MANIINTETSAYINANISIYAKNKIGQFSKYLNKNPLFVTYYSINQQLSRVDVGTGGIVSELGTSSPIRFNKILNLPVYNMPEIKPDIVYDESGMDIELDLSGITLLPNTVKPTPGDYLLLVFPGIKEILFRINNVGYNTIQSNDFYLIDLDIKDIGTDLEESRIGNQIVETYQTIFDNIGTQDKCFIKTTDIEKINGIVKILNYLKDLYKNLFYNSECNAFISPYEGLSQIGIYHYDYYLSEFITQSQIYSNPGEYNTLALIPNDTLPPDFEYKFSKTLLYAILNHSMDYINLYNYYYTSLITKAFSPFVMYCYNVIRSNVILSSYELTSQQCLAYNDGTLKEYFEIQLIKEIKNSMELTSTDYLDKIIYNYLLNRTEDINKDSLLNYQFTYDLRTYMYLPIIIYIINQYYNDYFK